MCPGSPLCGCAGALPAVHYVRVSSLGGRLCHGCFLAGNSLWMALIGSGEKRAWEEVAIELQLMGLGWDPSGLCQINAVEQAFNSQWTDDWKHCLQTFGWGSFLWQRRIPRKWAVNTPSLQAAWGVSAAWKHGSMVGWKSAGSIGGSVQRHCCIDLSDLLMCMTLLKYCTKFCSVYMCT